MNTDIEDLLVEGMERFTADLRAPAGLAHRARQRLRRRLALRSAAGTAALTAVGVTLAATGVPGTGHAGAGLAAYVVGRVNSALTAAEPGEIAQMTVTSRGVTAPGGKAETVTAEEWSYGAQWRSVTNSPAGHPLYDEGTNARSVYTLVSYMTRTWARMPGLGHPKAVAPGRYGCGPAVAALPLLFQYGLPGLRFADTSSTTVARAMRAAVSCGTLAVAGRQRVDGAEAIRLTSRPGSLISETIWVSPGTYLPVRVVIRPYSGSPVLAQTADIAWLPPTAQNLARLTVPIPAGFRQVKFAQAVKPVLRQVPGPLPKAARCPAPAGPAGPAGLSGPACGAIPRIFALRPGNFGLRPAMLWPGALRLRRGLVGEQAPEPAERAPTGDGDR